MGQLVQDAIAGLKDIKALEEDRSDSIWRAGDLLCRFHNHGFQSGFPHIDAEIVTAEDAEDLKNAVLGAFDQCTRLATKGSLIYALRNVGEPDLAPWCVEQLEHALRVIEGGSCLLGSCLEYLRNLGEDIHESEAAEPAGHLDAEVQRARKYLQRLNPTMDMPFPFDRKIPKVT